ncbi:hypothetical protein CTEN210_09641 [Chaetoceros tenuissimus]|uniref:Potassium channel tetramerisation-type BTB domain-containing protein n=1 Tax=Chaetoceros tenuissimus TaxID=426638 RepID=A0AAD3H7E7_9STRA|nr:hypothetical protein CTEN210_09641 [Chaetoceros tenuissimus]
MNKRERGHSTAEQQKRGKIDPSNIDGDTKPCDVLHLNIGGKRLDVLRRTLCSVEDSMLATKFSGRWEDSLEKDRDGNIFINQEYSLFKAMVDYLRNKEMETEAYPVPPPKFDRTSKQDFYRMLSYYGMLFAIYPLKLNPHEKYPPESAMVSTSADGTTVIETKSFCAFKLSPYEHGESNALTSFEIKLGEVDRCEVGLEMVDECYQESSFSIATRDERDEMKDYSFDISETDYANYYREEINVSKGTTIRVENLRTWVIGKTTVASDDIRSNFSIRRPDAAACYDTYFNISVQGKVTLTNFKYT